MNPDSKLPKETAKRTELRKRSFNRNAALYDRARPSYPEELFGDLARLTSAQPTAHGLRPTANPNSEPLAVSRQPSAVCSRILEIGPGTGQATLPLAKRGFSILGLELGKRMAELARGKLREFPNVEIRNVAFEDWILEPEAFDIVLAATAFHWIPGRVAWPRCAKILKPGGYLALLWNFPDLPDTPVYQELRAVYHELMPQREDPRPPVERVERQKKKIVSSGRFGPVTIRCYPWQREYTTREYISQLRTQSDHAILAPENRARLFRAIRAVIDRHGGRIVRPVVAVLFLAPKRTE
jgi:SAM-dependent methyltransferase